MSVSHPRRGRPLAAALAAAAFLLPGCTPRPVPPVVVRWLVARPEPRFDPDGPPQPERQALERLLTRPLVERDSAGPRPGAAESWSWSRDSLTLTFRLPAGLRFTDGTPCRSLHFEHALRAGLGRRDHGTRTWELAPLRGVESVRAGRPLPTLGIETPDSATLVLRLSRRDPALLERLARPGVAEPWKERGAGSWGDAVGLGPMRVVATVPGQRLTLAADGPGLPDTVAVRFAIGEGRTRAVLRAGAADLVWPLPPFLLDEPIPPGYRVGRRSSTRSLALVMRADLPPTSRQATRRALILGINRPDLVRSLGSAASPPGPLIPGARPFEAPGYDLDQMRKWMVQGRLGRSFHVALAYDADGPAARIARQVQGAWSRSDVYVALLPRRGAAWPAEALGGNRSHLLLAEYEPLAPGLAGAVAPLVMPLRGPAIGSFRTGWRTRDFDGLAAGTAATAPAPGDVQLRLEQELVVVPIARLATEWVERDGAHLWSFGGWPGPRFARSVASR